MTHGLTYLSQADLIVVMREGKISEMGSYQELLSHNGELAALVRGYLTEDVDEDQEHDPEGVLQEQFVVHAIQKPKEPLLFSLVL